MLTRIVIVPWIPVLIVFLLATVLLRRTFAPRHLGHAMLIGGLAALCVAPIVLRNWSEYRVFALTAQGGSHLAYWVVPLVKEAQDGTPWERTADLMKKRVMARDPAAFTNAFEESRVSAEVGREALKELGYAAIVKAWITAPSSISPRPRSFCRRRSLNCRGPDSSEPPAPRRSKRSSTSSSGPTTGFTRSS